MAQVGAKLKLFHGAVDGDPTTELHDITDLQFPELTAADVKNTTYETEDMVHDYVPGFAEGGEVTVMRNFSASSETAVRDLFRIRKKWKVQIQGDEAGDFQFEGYVNKIGPGVPVDEKLTQKFSIKVCSKPVWTPD